MYNYEYAYNSIYACMQTNKKQALKISVSYKQ